MEKPLCHPLSTQNSEMPLFFMKACLFFMKLVFFFKKILSFFQEEIKLAAYSPIVFYS